MEVEFPIHHVIVVGFHHKKGCQIEYAYPPFEVDIEKTAWKHLPTLAMPDGAHNFSSDTVYFHLPSLKRLGETVFGVACYQQIDADKVKNKGEDVTRSTIQKSVCVLSKFPLYGHIQVKMSLITAAYFREGDFSQVSILEEAYHNLNACLCSELLTTPEAFVGLSPRDLIFTFRSDVIVLLKLLLLEKRILFRGASVGPLCSVLLSLVSLLPLTLEYGLGQAASVKLSKTLSIIPQFSEDFDITKDPDQEKMDTEKPSPQREEGDGQTQKCGSNSSKDEGKEKRTKDLINSSLIQGSVSSRNHHGNRDGNMNTHADMEIDPENHPDPDTVDEGRQAPADLKSPTSEAGSDTFSEKVSEDIPDFLVAVQMTAVDGGLPLQIFSKGYLCHPYLSLHYLDLLSDPGVRGFIVGATNILFKQKRDLHDVVVEMQDGSVEIPDPVLKRMVTLTTEDLRFAESLVRNVTQDSSFSKDGDSFLEGVGWEGGDEWIRAQFKYYLMCALRTSLCDDGHRSRDTFGSSFLTTWQSTHHWKIWSAYQNAEERETPGIYALSPGHPYSGQLSLGDMKLRFAHSMGRSESGRKLNQAVGKAVASTGKAVGGALSQAKGALSSWWSSVTTPTERTGIEIGGDEVSAAQEKENTPKEQASTESEEENSRRQTVWFI